MRAPSVFAKNATLYEEPNQVVAKFATSYEHGLQTVKDYLTNQLTVLAL